MSWRFVLLEVYDIPEGMEGVDAIEGGATGYGEGNVADYLRHLGFVEIIRLLFFGWWDDWIDTIKSIWNWHKLHEGDWDFVIGHLEASQLGRPEFWHPNRMWVRPIYDSKHGLMHQWNGSQVF